MKVSVILTSYNRRKYLQQAVASVFAQTFQDWELLIVDDDSDDGSYYVVEPFLSDKIRWLRTDLKHDHDSQQAIVAEVDGHPKVTGWLNRYAHNINLAFPQSKGEYITYLCDDDLYLPWRLEMMVRCMDFDPKAMVMYGKQQMLAEGADGKLMMGKVRNTVGVTLKAAQQIDHSSVIHRRDCFEKVGGWDEAAPMRYGDAAFFERLNKAGYAFYPIQLVMDCHRYNPSSVTWKIDHQTDENIEYPVFDDLGNKRLVNSGVDPVFSAI